MCVLLGAAAAGAAGAGAMGGIGSAIGALSSVASIGIGIMQSRAQNEAAAAQYRNQVEMVNRQEEQSQKTLNLQVAEQRAQHQSDLDKAQGEKADNRIRAYKAESRATAAAAESGVTGLSVDNLIGDIQGEAARFDQKIAMNSKVSHQQGTSALKNAQRQGAARIASMEIPVAPKFNTGLQIGSAVLSGLGGVARSFA